MAHTIDLKAFELVGNLISQPHRVESPQPKPELVASLKEGEILDLSDRLSNEGIFREAFRDGTVTKIVYSDAEGKTFFTDGALEEFDLFISEIWTEPYIGNNTSRSFVEDRTFKWMVKTHKNGRAEQDLLAHLTQEIDSVVEELEYFFPVINLNIDLPFTVGGVEFNFFTKEHLNEFFNYINAEKPKMTEEEFTEIFRRDYQGRVIAKVVVKAEPRRADEIARRKVELAVDAMKVAVLSFMVQDLNSSFDLNHRLNYQRHSHHLIKPTNSALNYVVSLNFPKGDDVTFTKEFLEKVNLLSLRRFGDFVALQNGDELYRYILDGIEQFSFAYSISDLHRRAIALITVLESLVLEEDLKRGMEDKALTRMSKILPGTFAEKQQYKAVFSRVYQIRHKMIHKAIRLPINETDIHTVQYFLAVMIVRLIEMNLNEAILDKDALVAKLNAQIN